MPPHSRACPGSNMLIRNQLNKHPNIHMHFELYK